LPHCAAIVHHGGIGTTSQALAAGIPQLIRPMAFDQFDNANRIEKLGCGRWLRNDRNLANELQQILDKPVEIPGNHHLATDDPVAAREPDEADAAAHAVRCLEKMLSDSGQVGSAR